MNIITYQELDYIAPQLIFELVANDNGTIFFDSAVDHEHYAQYSYILINPLIQYTANNNITLQQQIEQWKALINQNQQYNPHLPPFQGGLAGYMSYDLVRDIEYLPTNKPQHLPKYHFGLYNQVIAFDHINKKCYAYVCNIHGYDCDYIQQLKNLVLLHKKAQSPKINNLVTELPKLNITSNLTRDDYIKSVKKTIKYIRDGDIFEVNLSQCFSGKIDKTYPVPQLYAKLRRINPAPFACYLNFDKIKI